MSKEASKMLLLARELVHKQREVESLQYANRRLKAEVERMKGVLRSILQNAEFWDDEDDSLAIIHKLASEALNNAPDTNDGRKAQ